MKRFLLLSSLLASTFAMNAQVTPKVKPETLVAGKQYVLVNRAQTASQYMSRTSWDGALYFLGETDSKYADHALTAVDNGDGTWSFTIPNTEEEGAVFYMGLPSNSDNLNIKSTDPVMWTVTASEEYEGFYRLTAGEGNNPNCEGRQLHLNAGYQYFVISEPINGGVWYPDYAGGATPTGEYDEHEEEIYIIHDYTSFNWGFLTLEKVSDFYADLRYSGSINKLYTDYCDLEDYAEGFLATYNAAKDIYEAASDIDELYDSDLMDMLTNKVELYEEIEKAIALNEDEDAVLAAAIATAKTAFTQKTAANEVKSAIQALAQAELNYSMGNGDVTALGQNMSFEDLSAQAGTTSSSVAAPPAGWNVIINGTSVTTADEVRAAGVTAWHGVNADCSGDEKDGSYGFGIWSSSIPTYELSQTISGLDNGSYIVRAALMVGANGNGSRRTTQRLFGNLNSTYFGSADEYDETELDNSEVYDFAYLTEPITDTEMQGLEVRAFVYDGTLTFGVRTDGNCKAALRTSGNGAGGDGWFKVDNFTIQKVGYDVEDALSILTHYANILDDYESEAVMSEAKREQLESLQDTYSNIDAGNTQEEIVQCILSAKDMIVKVSASVKAYQRLRDAIDGHYDTRDQYDYKKGIQAYSDAIDAADAAYSDAEMDDEAEIDALIQSLNDALQACIQSDDITAGDYLTEYIQNPSFEDWASTQGNDTSGGVENAPKGWNLYINGAQVSTAGEISAAGVANWCAINRGDNINVELEGGTIVTQQPSDGDHLWGIWTGTIPAVELSQTLKNMPAGTYTVICDVLVQYNWAGDCLTTQRIFANDYVAMYSSEDRYEANLPADAQIAADIDRLTPDATIKHLTYAGYQCEAPRSDYSYPVSLTFGLAEKGDITIGFRTNNIGSDGTALDSGKGWFKLDNWQLIYEASEVPVGAEVGADATGVDAVEETKQAAVEFYSINGTRLAAPQKGINLVKMSNGTIVKTYVQ